MYRVCVMYLSCGHDVKGVHVCCVECLMYSGCMFDEYGVDVGAVMCCAE